jgi:putative ABC transport system permease protein
MPMTTRGWPGRWLDEAVQDLRYAIRTFARAPGFSIVVLLVLALGIGANTAIFSLLNVVVLRPLPVRDPDRLVQLLSQYPGEPRLPGMGWKHFERFRAENQVFSDLIAVAPVQAQVGADRSRTDAVTGMYADGRFFEALGLTAAAGRLLDPNDDRVGISDPAVVIGWAYWQSRYGGDPAAVGSPIAIDGATATIVGVAPRDFAGVQVGVRADIWLPFAMEPIVARPSRLTTGELYVGVIGRLKDGVTIEQAQTDMTRLNQWRVDDLSSRSRDPQLQRIVMVVESARGGFLLLQDELGTPLIVLMSGVGVLLLLACTNVASLLLARAAARQREFAVRVALGAGRLRLLRQAWVESLILSTGGAVLGIGIAVVGARTLARIFASGRRAPGLRGALQVPVEIDSTVVLFVIAACTLTGLAIGLVPAVHATGQGPATTLREMWTAGATRSRRLLGNTLVTVQVALSVVLVGAAGLFMSHLSSLRSVDLGFARDSVLLVSLDPAGSGYNRQQLTAMYRTLLDRLGQIPAVRAATLSAVTPIHGAGAARFVTAEGYVEPADQRRYVAVNWVAPRYFETFRTPLIAGREFAFEDEGRAPMAIVNQAFARHYFADRDPVGRVIRMDGDDAAYEIVGVVADAKYYDLRQAAPRTVYLSAFQQGRIQSQFTLRTGGSPMNVAADVRRLVQETASAVKISGMRTLADQMDASIVPERLVAALSGMFGGLAALLAAIGVYGLLAFTVAKRTQEIGVRAALGATRRDLTIMILKDALRMAAAGIAGGVAIALGGQRIAASLIGDLKADPSAMLTAACATMLLVAIAAAYLPARRASRISPLDALRR